MNKLESWLTGTALIIGLFAGIIVAVYDFGFDTLETILIKLLFVAFLFVALMLYEHVLIKQDTPFWNTWRHYWRS